MQPKFHTCSILTLGTGSDDVTSGAAQETFCVSISSSFCITSTFGVTMIRFLSSASGGDLGGDLGGDIVGEAGGDS